MREMRSGSGPSRSGRSAGAEPRPPLTDALADRLNIAALLWACALLGLLLPPLDDLSAVFDGRLITMMFAALVWVPLFAAIFQAVGWRYAMPLARSLRSRTFPDEPAWTRAFETTVAALWPIALPYWLVTAAGIRIWERAAGPVP